MSEDYVAGRSAANRNVKWAYCAEDDCIGVRLATGDMCWAHADKPDWDLAIKQLHEGGKLDARGVSISGDLLDKILAAGPHEKGKPVLAHVDFSAATLYDADFIDVIFDGTAKFGQATFHGKATFTMARFQRGAGVPAGRGLCDFSGAAFCGEAWFIDAVFECHTYFDETTFQRGARFVGTRFREEAEFSGATFGGDTWFRGATFGGTATFAKATFQQCAGFDHGARFHGDADFREATFSGDADFYQASFDRGSDGPRDGGGGILARDPLGIVFSGATFQQGGGFQRVTFREGADFSEVAFSGRADFRKATFGEDALFRGVIFGGDAVFDGRGRGATFEESADFGGATFRTDAEFGGVTVGGDATFDGANFDQARRIGPLLVFQQLNLDSARFAQPVRIEASTQTLLCRQAQFFGGVQLWVRWARVVLDDTDFASSSTVTGIPRLSNGNLAEEEQQFARLWRQTLGAEIPERPRLLSLQRANVAGLGLSSVDLSLCRFAGAHNLDKLRLDADVLLAISPTSLKWDSRTVIAEERAWRARRSSRWTAPPSPKWALGGPTDLEAGQIAALYRALRKGREDNKDEPGAAGFYYGEMEMRRHARGTTSSGTAGHTGEGTRGRVERGILTAYWLVSGYGLMAWRAFAWLGALIAGFAVAFDQIGFARAPHPPSYWACLLYAFRATLSLTDNTALTAWGELLQALLRLSGPVLLGLGLLALRNRVKR